MCIALPRKVVAVVDPARAIVALAADDGAAGEAETVSAALLVDDERGVDALVGAWMLVHAGFALAVIDEEDARSRLQMFAAMRGDPGRLDLSDLHAELDPDLNAAAAPKPRRLDVI
ncbi:MAG: HypC/HybG/HupF family hydrogenase formation chaperone [Rhodoplanes sp.]|uniref:HypC/HybG/HupF family hydrogenase formation chaperone n=1 Tax=Rhodoplanes sp. TaxID=1968906 RepID=UPI0017AE5EC2|nr:HypC/HybG/HupF family hydrogenase formation chaperone [Rhodoplanes sp.]NVO15255.1 HypC/HybG/HupF family hydrogenase formation chaperone [Rhodoplanes sp.]